MLSPAVRRVRNAGVLGLFAAACESPVGLPSGAVRFTPPAVYGAWWKLTERCSGKTGDLASIRWYLVTTGTFDLQGETDEGAWYEVGNRIAIASGFAEDGALVRHEMLHALLRAQGHPRGEFLGSCGDIVVCDDQCMLDAGGPPDTSGTPLFVSPGGVSGAVVVVPDTVSASTDSGWFTVTVELTNPASRPVHVAVPFDSAWISIGFSGMSGGESTGAYQIDALAFAPAGTAGSVRRTVFDVQPLIPGQVDLPPGQYTVGGRFLTDSTPRAALTVTR